MTEQEKIKRREEHDIITAKAGLLIKEVVENKYSLVENQVEQLSIVGFYDGALSGEAKLHDGRLGKYEIKQDYEEEGLEEDYAECSYDFRYFLVTIEEKVIGYITEEFVNQFRPYRLHLDGEQYLASGCKLSYKREDQ